MYYFRARVPAGKTRIVVKIRTPAVGNSTCLCPKRFASPPRFAHQRHFPLHSLPFCAFRGHEVSIGLYARGRRARFMHELSEPVSQQSHCAVVSASRVRKSRAGDKSTYSKHKVTCIFPTSCKSYRYFCHQFKNCNYFVLVALLL